MAEPPAGYAPGGLMHGYRATYSQDTKNLLKSNQHELICYSVVIIIIVSV